MSEKELYIAIFRRFLIQNNKYIEYKQLWEISKGKAYKDLYEWFANHRPSRFLFSAFTWPSSEWGCLNREWELMVCKINNNNMLTSSHS